MVNQIIKSVLMGVFFGLVVGFLNGAINDCSPFTESFNNSYLIIGMAILTGIFVRVPSGIFGNVCSIIGLSISSSLIYGIIGFITGYLLRKSENKNKIYKIAAWLIPILTMIIIGIFLMLADTFSGLG